MYNQQKKELNLNMHLQFNDVLVLQIQLSAISNHWYYLTHFTKEFAN